jgi:Trk-type K+ transport system membrane component
VLVAASVGPGETMLQATARGLGALAGAGESIATLLPSHDLLLHAVFLPLGIFGALGAVVMLEAWHAIVSRRRVSGHTLRVLAMAGLAYLIGLVLLTPLLGGYSKSNILLSSNLVAAALGLGNASTPLSQLPRGGEGILVAVAMLGVGTLGTQGGLVLAWTKTIPERLLRKLLTWVGCELAILLLGLILLLQAEPALAADRGMVLVVNAVLNVGLSHGAVSISGNGLLVLSAVMLVGRLLPLLVVMAWVSEQTDRKV